MSEQNFWLNLPVKDVDKAKIFYQKIGFELNTSHGDSENMASFFIGSHKTVLMLFEIKTFQTFIQGNVIDTKQGNEVLLNLSVQSSAEVDQIEKSVIKAGGKVFVTAHKKDSWMYGMGFSDLDGHKWSVLYMDMNKAPNN